MEFRQKIKNKCKWIGAFGVDMEKFLFVPTNICQTLFF